MRKTHFQNLCSETSASQTLYRCIYDEIVGYMNVN